MSIPNLDVWPGRELRDNTLREIAQKLCREQGWKYQWKNNRSKPRLINPAGEYATLPRTPSSYGSVLQTISWLKRLGADLDVSVPRRSSFVGESLKSDTTELPFSDTEWRERHADAPEWRQRLAGYVPPPPPVKPVVSEYTAGLLGRLTGAAQVRPDAMGNGQWSLDAARQLLRDGYSLDRVIERTGWGRMWLADLADRLASG